MKQWIRAAFVACLLVVGHAAAADAPPSEASIRQLLDTMHAERMIGTISGQMRDIMRNQMLKSLGHAPDAEEQQIIERGVGRLNDSFAHVMTWEKMEPWMISMYQQNFTAKEVADLTTFYGSPTGRSVMDKMPMIMQSSLQHAQEMLHDSMPQFQQIGRDMGEELKAYHDSKKQ